MRLDLENLEYYSYLTLGKYYLIFCELNLDIVLVSADQDISSFFYISCIVYVDMMFIMCYVLLHNKGKTLKISISLF